MGAHVTRQSERQPNASGKSKQRRNSDKKISAHTNGVEHNSQAYQEFHKDPNCPVINEEEKQLLKKTWSLIKDDINKVGVVTFMGLFETHPDTQNAFVPFKNIPLDDMRYSDTLREHALRVMTTVDKVMSRIDDMSKVFDLLTELGQRHASYNAKPEYIDLIGPQFLFAIQPALGENWTIETESVWSKLIRLMTYIIRINMSI